MGRYHRYPYETRQVRLTLMYRIPDENPEAFVDRSSPGVWQISLQPPGGVIVA